ncbi:hypothetical protein RIF29_23543 [Crotalaria pallida]|uniref:BZIP domain-containing protein n=1 Tax=Crotalaria pallida TaxID=3830 RepID=A0AAN9F5U1_CROPI
MKSPSSSPKPQFSSTTTNFIPTLLLDPSPPPPPPTSSRTVDDVWREIVAGNIPPDCKEEAPDDDLMTLEDFLVKAGAVGEDDNDDDDDDDEVKMPMPMPMPLTQRLSSGGSMFAYDPVYQGGGMESLEVVGFGNGVEGGVGGGSGGGRGKRGRAVSEQLDKAAQQRQKRMIKNRESAARSRERKQAYQVELESLAIKLEEENDRLMKEKAEKRKERYKQLMEKIIPVVEKRKPPRLLRRVYLSDLNRKCSVMTVRIFITMSIFSIFFFFFLLLKPSHSTTLIVDGSSEWKNPTVSIGDSIIFKHKQHYNLYIFKNQKAFNLCNFTQATLLTNPNTASYTWHPSRPGYFYFSFNNGSLKACQDSQKLAIKVSFSSSEEEGALPPSSQGSANAPQHSPTIIEGAPGPSSGGEVASTPSFPWPFRPGQAAASPPALSPVTVPLVPEKSGGGGGMPFINSNPAVPLPTGEVDSATIRPLPTSSAHQGQVVMIGFHIAVLHSMVALLLLLLLGVN